MEISPERIRERLIALGKNPGGGGQSWLAREVGMKPQGIQSIMAGDVKRPRKLFEIAATLKTTEAYLLGQTDEPGARAADQTSIELMELFGDLMKAPVDLQGQVAAYIRKRLKARQEASRETAT